MHSHHLLIDIRPPKIPLRKQIYKYYQELRPQYTKNLLIGYLNINSLRNKISDLRVLLVDLQLDYFVISETKLDDSFPSAQFVIQNYKIRARRDADGHGGGLIEFVKRGVICKRVN